MRTRKVPSLLNWYWYDELKERSDTWLEIEQEMEHTCLVLD